MEKTLVSDPSAPLVCVHNVMPSLIAEPYPGNTQNCPFPVLDFQDKYTI